MKPETHTDTHPRAVPVETLTLSEAARYLILSDKTLLEMVDRGEVPAAKPGRAWVFYLPHLRDYLTARIEDETAQRREGKTPLYITRNTRRAG